MKRNLRPVLDITPDRFEGIISLVKKHFPSDEMTADDLALIHSISPESIVLVEDPENHAIAGFAFIIPISVRLFEMIRDGKASMKDWQQYMDEFMAFGLAEEQDISFNTIMIDFDYRTDNALHETFRAIASLYDNLLKEGVKMRNVVSEAEISNRASETIFGDYLRMTPSYEDSERRVYSSTMSEVAEMFARH